LSEGLGCNTASPRDIHFPRENRSLGAAVGEYDQPPKKSITPV
jgi:hypothetical protein